MTALYNEIDPHKAEWLRRLIDAGHIAPGVVDTRPIEQLQGRDFDGDSQVHLFAGIGIWSHALRLAGWPDDRPVWTGSCPCQPFSTAGKREGTADKRHLWPEMFRLVNECRPPVVIGEQVPGAVRLGWLDGVFADLESVGYSCGAVDLAAASVGAPHIRQRIWWVADSGSGAGAGVDRVLATHAARQGDEGAEPAHGCANGRLVHAEHRRQADEEQGAEPWAAGDAGGMEHAAGVGLRGWCANGNGLAAGVSRPGLESVSDRLGDADDAGPQGRRLQSPSSASERAPWATGFALVPCADGKARRVESGTFPLAHGDSVRVGRAGLLRGYGDAIVAPLAAEFIGMCMEVLHRLRDGT